MAETVGQCAECNKDATGLYVTRYRLLCLDCAIAHKEIVKQYPKMLALAKKTEIGKRNLKGRSQEPGVRSQETTGSLF